MKIHARWVLSLISGYMSIKVACSLSFHTLRYTFCMEKKMFFLQKFLETPSIKVIHYEEQNKLTTFDFIDSRIF